MKVTQEDINRIFEHVTYVTTRVGNSNVTAAWAFLPDNTYLGYGESMPVLNEEFDAQMGIDYAIEKAKIAAEDTIREHMSLSIRLTGTKPDLLANLNIGLKRDEIIDTVIKNIIDESKVSWYDQATMSLSLTLSNINKTVEGKGSNHVLALADAKYKADIILRKVIANFKEEDAFNGNYYVASERELQRDVNKKVGEILDAIEFDVVPNEVNDINNLTVTATSPKTEITASAFAATKEKGIEDTNWELGLKVNKDINNKLLRQRDCHILLNSIVYTYHHNDSGYVSCMANTFDGRYIASESSLTPEGSKAAAQVAIQRLIFTDYHDICAPF